MSISKEEVISFLSKLDEEELIDIANSSIERGWVRKTVVQSYCVRIISVSNRTKGLRLIHSISDLNLSKTKDFIDNLPRIYHDFSGYEKTELESLKKKLNSCGCITYEVITTYGPDEYDSQPYVSFVPQG